MALGCATACATAVEPLPEVQPFSPLTLPGEDPVEPVFDPVAPFTVDIAYIFENSSEYLRDPDTISSGHSFVAVQPDRVCFDVFSEDAAIVEQLHDAKLVSPRDIIRVPEPVRFRLTLDGVTQVPANRASYQMLDGEVIISSSAW